MCDRSEWYREKAIQDDDHKNCFRWLNALLVRGWTVKADLPTGSANVIVHIHRPHESDSFEGETVTQALRKAAWNKVFGIDKPELEARDTAGE